MPAFKSIDASGVSYYLGDADGNRVVLSMGEARRGAPMLKIRWGSTVQQLTQEQAADLAAELQAFLDQGNARFVDDPPEARTKSNNSDPALIGAAARRARVRLS
jgi:hypothetical protein